MKSGVGRMVLEEAIKREILVNNVFEDLALNQNQWHCVIHVAYLTRWNKTFVFVLLL